MSDCAVCLAAENGSDESLRSLVRWQAIKLNQARDALFPLQIELGQAKDRIRHLEEVVAALNKKVVRHNLGAR